MASAKCWRRLRPGTDRLKQAARILICAVLALCATARADTARVQLERFSDGLETLHARFEQVVVSTDGKVQDSSAGEVWLRRPDRFRWEYGGDFPEIVVADGNVIWIYDEMLEQVTVKDPAETEFSSPLSLLTDPDALEDAFEIREVGETDEARLLELRARSMEVQFERFLLGMNGDSPVLIIIEDAFGLRTEIRFSEVERNVSLEDKLFEFTPPAGADVIGALPGSG